MLKLGDIGEQVKRLQKLLTQQGYNLSEDAIFGERTQKHVRDFQRKKGLVIDGVVGEKTMAALTLNSNHQDKLLKQANLVQAAETLDVDLAAIMAVNYVESKQSGFLPDGRPRILFERHVMYDRLKDAGYPADDLAVKHPNLVNKKPGAYRGGWAEHTRLNSAKQIDNAIAQESCSWGQYQIMGFHWQHLGFDSIDAFVAAMSRSEKDQLAAFVLFIQKDTKLHNALKQKKWEEFAKIYNGPAYKRNFYHHRLAAAFAEFKEVA